VLFENDEKKNYLPVETCGSINVYSNVAFSSTFFEYARDKHLQVNLFDKYGEYVGCFTTANHYDSVKTMLKQAMLYNDEEKRLAMAKNMEVASLHNQRENLRYYYKHRRTDKLKAAIDAMTQCISEMKTCGSVGELMLVEARGKQKYFSAFDDMLNDDEFIFEKRTRRPPKNAVNAMISFGNVFLYQRVATEINKTALDIRIGFVHAANNRSQSLNLDIAEIFKPIVVDRAIFTSIHNREITLDRHFQKEENGGVYLNKDGKRIFIHELEHKLYQKISVGGTAVTYDALIRNEIRKIVHYVQMDEKYKAYKYT
jgi:CRISPR-associated endonuclease Cas1 subtype I-B